MMKQQFEQALSKTESESEAREHKQARASYDSTNIALLEARNFIQEARHNNVVVRAISIYKLDKLIKDKQQVDKLLNNNKALKKLVCKCLSRVYADYKNVFSKADFNILLLHQKNIDHDIILKQNNNLLPSSLYSMFLEQLEMVKAYLEDHLQKGFIIASDMPYASPVLFAKKSEERWQFCVDY